MTNTRSFLFIFVLFASLNPLCSFASRGLYFSVSQMTSNQQNTISDYKQGTVVDVQLLKLPQSNVVDNAAINGKSFDFTANNTAGSGYLSYDVLKSALDDKVMTGDVTFTVKTSSLDTLQTTYTVGAASGSKAAGSLTLNGANIAINGAGGTSSLTIDPATSGGTTTYTIDGTTGTTTSSIVASNKVGNNVCILDQATAVEACAPKAYITAKYGSTNSVPVKELFNDIKKSVDELKTTHTTQIRNGVSTLVYELPLTGTVNGTAYTQDSNTISTITNGAAVTFGAGSVVTVTNGKINSFTQPTSKSISISGSTTTTTKYACTDSTGNLKTGECDVENIRSAFDPVDAGTSTPYTIASSSDTTLFYKDNKGAYKSIPTAGIPTENTDKNKYITNYTMTTSDLYPSTTLFYKDNTGAYKSIPTTGIPTEITDKNKYIPNTYQTISQSGLSSTLINDTSSQTITTDGKATFVNGTLNGSDNTFTGIVQSGNVTTATNTVADSGIDLYSSLLNQTRYLSTPYLSITQNVRLDISKIGANFVVNDLRAMWDKNSQSTLDDNVYNALSYIDGDKIYQGIGAWNKLSEAVRLATDAFENIQSYASVADIAHTAYAFMNSASKNFEKCVNTLCGLGMDYSTWRSDNIPALLSLIEGLSAQNGVALNVVNLTTDVFNTFLEASKATNIASYQANYVKGSGTEKNVDLYGYKLDNIGQKVKDGTYNVTLRAKDWSFETQRVKDLVISDVSSRSLAPQFSTQSQMQNFVSALSGQGSSGFEMSVGYKFRMFKSAFYAAPQLDISMFRNNSSTISRNDSIKSKDGVTGLIDLTNNVKVTYGNLDSSYAGSLVAKFGFENKLNLGIFRTPFSVYGFGGGTSGLTTYRSANSQSFGLKYGFGGEIFVSKKLAIFGEMFWINFLKQNINYSQTSNYDPPPLVSLKLLDFIPSVQIDSVPMFINSQIGTTVTLDNSQYDRANKILAIKYADFNQVIDTSSIKYTTNESFANQASIQGVKFGLTYYVE